MIEIVKKVKSKVLRILNLEPLPFYTKDIFKYHKFKIGEYTYGTPNVLFENNEANLQIGKFCSIAEGVTIFLGGNHRTDWITTYPFNSLADFLPFAEHIKGHPVTKGDVIIGNDVWIGRNVTIMSGITIGNGAVIATESIVTKNIGSYEVWGGNPAIFLKKRFDDATINQLENINWWNWDLKKIKDNIDLLCSNNIKQMHTIYDKKN
jgi:acetyltransferase-like isoleucine patch superfamily enzyme